MYVLIVSPPIPRLLYWSENCVEVRGHQQQEEEVRREEEQGGQLEVGYPWGSQDVLCQGEIASALPRLHGESGSLSVQGAAVVDSNIKTNESKTSSRRAVLTDVSLQPTVSFFTMCASKKLLMITTSICACASFAFLCIAVATDYWIYMQELFPLDNGSFVKLDTEAGLWRRCERDERKGPSPIRTCRYIEYFEVVETEGMGPTEQIIFSFRRCVVFPILGLLILLAGQIVCFMGHCNHRKKILTFVAGIIYVVGGLCTLVGIILFIGAITEEAGHSGTGKGEQKFTYHYKASFVLTVASFIVSELTGVLSVYLYISRHKHAYKKKQERVILNDNRSMTNSRSNFHGSRSLSRERSHDNSPSHSDTYYTYTPVSESSKEMSNYTFPRDPSRYTLPDTRTCRNYPHAQSSQSVHEAADTYASRRDIDNYSRARDNTDTCRRDMDTYSRRTTPV